MADLRIFGYGSLIWRPDFPYTGRQVGRVVGFSRRFYQGSCDHRGTVQRPGRVTTLVEEAAGECVGVVYTVPERVAAGVLASLDVREQGGYERRALSVHGAGAVLDNVLLYFAGPQNPHYLGPAPMSEMVQQILGAKGDSGSNADYVLNLARALRQEGFRDAHVERLAHHLELTRGSASTA